MHLFAHPLRQHLAFPKQSKSLSHSLETSSQDAGFMTSSAAHSPGFSVENFKYLFEYNQKCNNDLRQ